MKHNLHQNTIPCTHTLIDPPAITAVPCPAPRGCSAGRASLSVVQWPPAVASPPCIAQMPPRRHVSPQGACAQICNGPARVDTSSGGRPSPPTRRCTVRYPQVGQDLRLCCENMVVGRKLAQKTFPNIIDTNTHTHHHHGALVVLSGTLAAPPARPGCQPGSTPASSCAQAVVRHHGPQPSVHGPTM